MKRICVLLLALAMTLALTACGGETAVSSEAAYPAQNINGVVQWGVGGGTDSLMRPLAALAERKLGKSIVIQNMAGATGSVATQYVYDAPADGYHLLMGAENPALYDVLDISALTYEDFDCVFLVGDEVVGVVVGRDSPYASFSALVEAALARPGELKLSTTGKGGMPWEVAAFITDVTGATFNQIPYDSDASAKNAVINGECDFTVCKVQSGVEDYRAGNLTYLCMFSAEPVAALPDVPLIVDEFPDFDRYLPWGPFYGVFVRTGTDAAVIQTLSEAFSDAAPDQSYQDVLANFNVRFLGLTGKAAEDYISAWRANTLRALRSSGVIE